MENYELSWFTKERERVEAIVDSEKVLVNLGTSNIDLNCLCLDLWSDSKIMVHLVSLLIFTAFMCHFSQ